MKCSAALLLIASTAVAADSIQEQQERQLQKADYWKPYKKAFKSEGINKCKFLKGETPEAGEECPEKDDDYICFTGHQTCPSDVVGSSPTHPTHKFYCRAGILAEDTTFEPCYEPEGTILSCPATLPVDGDHPADTCGVALTCTYNAQEECCDDSLKHKNRDIQECSCSPDGKFTCKSAKTKTIKKICKKIECPEDEMASSSIATMDAAPMDMMHTGAALDVQDTTDNADNAFVPEFDENGCPTAYPDAGTSCTLPTGTTCSYNEACCPDGKCYDTSFTTCVEGGIWGNLMQADIRCTPQAPSLIAPIPGQAFDLPPPATKAPQPFIDPDAQYVFPEWEGKLCADALAAISALEHLEDVSCRMVGDSPDDLSFTIGRVVIYENDDGVVVGIPSVG